MKKASVLLSTAEDTRFEISPILTLVFDVEQVAAVTAEIEALVATSNTASRAAPDEDEPDDFDPRDEPAPIPRRSASEDGGDRP